MSIKFTAERFQKIKETYTLWWDRKLDRPLMKIVVPNAYEPDVPLPKAPLLSQENCHDFSYTPEEIIDAIDYDLSKKEYIGDAFPYVNFGIFGPGVCAAFCGAILDNSSGRVWFFPPKKQEIFDIHIKYDPNNKWVKRIKDLYKAGLKKWGDTVVMGLPDLGGIMDIVAIFCESENLLYDLYDNPEEVTRLRKEAEIAWNEAFDDLTSVIQSEKHGYSDWLGLYSDTPSYVIQCDFCYMIGNDMFKEFVLPSLENHVQKLDRTVYHLDGIGELNHFNDIVGLKDLNAIQWVSGDGKPKGTYWLNSVYKPMQEANKGIQIIGTIDEFFDVYKTINKSVFYAQSILKENLDEFKEKTKDLIEY